MSFQNRVYYRWPKDSKINDGSKGVCSEITVANPVSVGDIVDSPIGGQGFRCKVVLVVHEEEFSWLFVETPSEYEQEIIEDVPKF
ncbi:hypothetical protein [Reinekea sp. G2M2-21]|uniref:hypothetical protein n=1 Tax=Reinekea sp. G2M2-21 TaxID=2788942 RepID=UPI0018AB8CDB|nr:hypothetical protein [Reinekea sp. G2M2-21]